MRGVTNDASVPVRALAALAVAALAALLFPAAVRSDPPALELDTDPDGFAALAATEGRIEPDASARVEIVRDAGSVRSGGGALAYTYTLQRGSVKLLARPTKLPPEARSFRLWLRSTAPTVLLVGFREEGGRAFHLDVTMPANTWVPVQANLDELEPDDAAARGARLDPARVEALVISDFMNLALAAPAEIAGIFPPAQGERRVVLDEVRFSSEAVPANSGASRAGDTPIWLVDSFDSGWTRWIPARVDFDGGQLAIRLLPEEVALQVVPEAAAPGSAMPGRTPPAQGLRLTYRRAPMRAFAFLRNLERAELARRPEVPRRLQLSLNASQRSLLVLQLKERDGSEYRHLLQPEETVGWRNLDLPLTAFALDENSRDENDRLDPDQIRELAIVDASALLGGALPEGETTLEIDSVRFVLSP